MVGKSLIYWSTPILFKAELNHLKNTFAENGYPESVIHRFTSNKFIENLKQKIVEPQPPKDPDEFNEDKLWLRVPYDPYIWPKLQKICKEAKINLGASKSTNIGQILVTRKPKDPLQVSGGSVYCIPCCSCDHFYIGETIQKTHSRLQQHKSSCKNAIRKRTIIQLDKNDYGTSKHSLDTKHKWNFQETKILASVQNTRHRETREAIEIFCHKKKGYKLANILNGKEIITCWHEIL